MVVEVRRMVFFDGRNHNGHPFTRAAVGLSFFCLFFTLVAIFGHMPLFTRGTHADRAHLGAPTLGNRVRRFALGLNGCPSSSNSTFN